MSSHHLDLALLRAGDPLCDPATLVSPATIELVTERTGRAVAGAPVLAVWVDDEQLERIERARPSAVMIPKCRLRSTSSSG